MPKVEYGGTPLIAASLDGTFGAKLDRRARQSRQNFVGEASRRAGGWAKEGGADRDEGGKPEPLIGGPRLPPSRGLRSAQMNANEDGGCARSDCERDARSPAVAEGDSTCDRVEDSKRMWPLQRNARLLPPSRTRECRRTEFASRPSVIGVAKSESEDARAGGGRGVDGRRSASPSAKGRCTRRRKAGRRRG